jgi:hypothetical protein
MEVSLEPFTSPEAGLTYETRIVYTGLGRMNLHTRKLQYMMPLPDGHVYLRESDFPSGVVSRIYHTEHARVTEYTNPRRWTETIGDKTFHFTVCGSLTPKQT